VGSAARVRRGGASPGGIMMTADTMTMPAEATRAPIADCSPAPRSCAAPRSGVRGQGDEAHLPGGGGGQPLDHYPYGGERMVSAEQTPRKGVIWSRMTASAAAIGARLKGCARRSRGELGSVCRAPLLRSGRCSYMRRRPSRRLHRCAAELLMANTSG